MFLSSTPIRVHFSILATKSFSMKGDLVLFPSFITGSLLSNSEV